MLRCEIVQDLLPLYTENMVSPYTAQEVNSHLAGCPKCSAKFKEMSATAPNVQMRMDTAQQFIDYQKKAKKKTAVPVIIIAAIVIFLIFIGSFVAILALVGAFSINPVTSENYRILEYDPFVDFNLDEDKQNYSLYMGENALKEYRNKRAMDESIFPAELTEEMEVLNYKMLYHNPFDPQD